MNIPAPQSPKRANTGLASLSLRAGRGSGGGVRSVILLVSIILLAACNAASPIDNNTTGSSNGQQAATSTPIPTAPVAARPTYTVQRGDVSELLSFTGRWQPRDQATLDFEISGTVRQVNVQRGQAVLAGQLLADYQITDLENQLDSAELSLETALNQQSSSATGGQQSVEDAEISLANARISLQNTLNSRPWTNVASSQNSITSAQQSLEDAKRNYNDVLSHPDQDPSAVDNALNQIESAENQLDSAVIGYLSSAQNYSNYDYQIMQAQNQVIQAELALERARENQLTSNTDESVRSAQLQIDQIKAQIAQSSLYAPFDGVILEINIAPGDQVSAFDTVMTMALPEPKEVIASLAIGDVNRLSVGMIGTCNVANQPDTAVQCLIRRLPASSTDVDQSVRIAAQLDGTLDGSLIEIDMPLQIQENVLWLPPQAIRTFQNRVFVVLDTPEGPRTVDIEMGLQTDDRVEIISGVNEGDVVIAP